MADELKFEEALGQLEKLVLELEAGELGLDEAMKRFEKGVKLSRQLEQALEQAGRKVEKLTKKGGEAVLEPFEDGEGSAGSAAPPKRQAKGGKAGQDTLF